MRRMSSRAFGALAVGVMVAAVWGAGAVPAGARPAVKRFDAAGTYEATVPAAHVSSRLVLTEGPEAPNSGTFEFTDIGDYGNWVMQGRVVAMQIAASQSGHAGIVLIGHVTHDGIDGWVGVPGYGQITWSATR